MTINPLDDERSTFLVVVNHENEHALWPTHFGVPLWWDAVLGPDGRDRCIAHIEQHWPDIRPASPIRKAG